MKKFEINDRFVDRHIGPREKEISEMLSIIGYDNLDSLVDETIPSHIRLSQKMNLDTPMDERKFVEHLSEIASRNQVFRSYIGMGYYQVNTPAVIQRNILENPGWYTQYTPYQAEISQGRLEALLNFQTMVVDLTGMPIANASLLDEGTAAAEAMIMLHSLRKADKKNAHVFLVAENCFPQTIDVLKTRSVPLGIKLKIAPVDKFELNDDVFGIFVQYPDSNGSIIDYTELFSKAADKGIYKAIAADIMSLVLLTPPGEFGADVVVGSTQRFGIPMGFGGPHAAYFATKDEYKRSIPGRIIGVSVDTQGKYALRMALQTREQHIKREHATSNICTAQVLAIMASMYAVYHGPEGVKAIAKRIAGLTSLLNESLKKLSYKQLNNNFFDTLQIDTDKGTASKISELAKSAKMNFRYFDNGNIGISLSEITSFEDVKEIVDIFAKVKGEKFSLEDLKKIADNVSENIPVSLKRKSEFMMHPVFNSYYSETEMMRYIKNLERKDLSLTTSMIPLGSCTMKLNAASEMVGLSWREFASVHPFAPSEQVEGYKILIDGLEKQLCEITGFSAVSFQPNSGAQGEYSGLMVINAYHHSRGDHHRNVILIPSSAHGTNPASAVMAGGKVVVVKCNERGDIDINDLKEKAEQHKDDLSALMVTYPSTHGVFEEEITEMCKIVHSFGGQIYMDGANMNAQVGLTSPKKIGADVCHLNLHKTFCIPHGGGGPGEGPIAVAEHLKPFLPSHPVVKVGGEKAIPAVSSAPYGSASILLISYAYIKMMGEEGLTKATKAAILNANYIRAKLAPHYNVLFTGDNGNVAHELIFDLRNFKTSSGIEAEDVAKRLMDYGYHAPTVSFPVPGTIMVEPTESESKAELDKFCDSLIAIRKEIEEIETGEADKTDNVLKNAPHTASEIAGDTWNHKYSREKAAFPNKYTKENKFWPAVGRVNNAYGDRNLFCSCVPVSAYENEKAV